MTDVVPIDASGSPKKVNTFAIVSIVLAAISITGMVVGGIVVIAVFAVSAAHVAMQQIQARGERGAVLAYIALGTSYLIASYAVLTYIVYAITLVQQSNTQVG